MKKNVFIGTLCTMYIYAVHQIYYTIISPIIKHIK
jgi:hypothetical protein